MSEEILNAGKERIKDLLEPINGGVGEDVSYDEKFEQIKNETEKLSSLTGENCDWSSVAVLSEELLQEKSKDFRVACYLSTCKLRQGNVQGVLDGLLLLDQLTEKWWDEMYPPLRRLRARAGMVGWMSDQAGPLVIDYRLQAADGALVQAVDELSKKLDDTFRDKFADSYTGMTKLRDAIRHLVRTCPKEASKPAAAAAAPAPQQAAAPAQPRPPAPVAAAAPGAVEISDAQSAMRAVDATGKQLVRIAAAIRGMKPEDELAYRLSRMGMWMPLNKTPPTNDNKTLVPPPPAHVRQRLETLASSQDWMTLLNEAETQAGNYILWLDPHRYVSTAMSALGALFIKAKKELLMQVALVLQRVPALPKLAFNDGTPFASGPTQMWIDSEVLPALGNGEGGGGGGAAPSLLDEPLKEARELAVKGELEKAVSLVSHAAAAAPSPVDRFRGKLAVAQLCLGAGQLAVARGQLEALVGQIDRHDLGSWDPALCAEVYAALYSAIRGMNKPPAGPVPPGGAKPPPADELAAERAAFDKLCQLDPGLALKLGGTKTA